MWHDTSIIENLGCNRIFKKYDHDNYFEFEKKMGRNIRMISTIITLTRITLTQLTTTKKISNQKSTQFGQLSFITKNDVVKFT